MELNERGAKATDETVRRMVESVSEYGIIAIDPRGTIASWNAGAEKITGYPPVEVLGRSFSVLFTPEDREKKIPEGELETVLREGIANDTLWMLNRSGQRYWAEGSVTAVRDSAGSLIGYSKVFRDASDRRETEEQLRSIQERLTVALQAGRTGTWEWDIVHNRDRFDESLRAMFGLPPGQEVTTIEEFYSLVHPDDRPHVVAAFELTRTEGIHLDVEFRVVRPDGSVRWFIDHGELLFDENRRPVRMSGACVDVTERRNAEEELLRSRESFRYFVQNIRDYALFQVDPEGRITTWNTGAERMLGYSEAEILNRKTSILFTPEDIQACAPEHEIDQARETGRGVDERWHVRKDGTRLWCSGILTSMRDRDGRLLGFAKVMRDETEKRHQGEQLAASLREKESLLREIHHRVKNNLQVITSLLTLQANAVEDQVVRASLEETCQRVRSIGDIHELLYRSPELAEVDFQLYLERLVAHLLSFYDVDSERVRVVVDGGGVQLDIRQGIPCGLIVNELFTNALKHAFPAGRGGEIRVMLRLEGGDVRLEVSDTGVGGGRDFPPGSPGSLGLRLVAVLTKQLRGVMEASGESGTSVVIRFPVSA